MQTCSPLQMDPAESSLSCRLVVEQRTVTVNVRSDRSTPHIRNGHPTKLLDNQVCSGSVQYRSVRPIGDFLDSFTGELSRFFRYPQILLLSLHDFMSQSSCETGAKKQPEGGAGSVCVSSNLP